MCTLIKTTSEQLLGKRNRSEYSRTISESYLIDYESKDISSNSEILFDKIMSIQINNAIKIFSKDNFYYVFPLNKISDFFDLKYEVKYFLKNINKFGYKFIGNDKTYLYFEKNTNFLQDIIGNSITTINNNFIFNFNFLNDYSFIYVCNFIIKSGIFRILRCDKELGILVFTLI